MLNQSTTMSLTMKIKYNTMNKTKLGGQLAFSSTSNWKACHNDSDGEALSVADSTTFSLV